MSGKLIVMEGSGDGVGKSTQGILLKERLIQDNKKVFSHHFPSYETYQGSLVEHYLSGELGLPQDLSPYFINSLYAVDRAITWKTLLKKEYESGKYVLLDRYTTSSLIYQSSLLKSLQEKKDFIDYVLDFEYNKLKIKEPDKVIFLHVPFELNNELRKSRKTNDGIENDIHESNLDYLKQIYETSLFISEYLNWDKVECSKDNKMKSVDEIHQKVYSLIKSE